VPQDVLRDVGEIEALLRQAVDHAEAGAGVARDERRRELVEDGAIGDAEHARHVLAGELGAADTR
jgi:hypothetical protein